MWRTEMWHPVTVHFPIALLLAATFSMVVSFFVRTDRKKYWQYAAAGLLLGGCAGAWMGIYTGDLADGIVSRKICDPTVLKDHENAGFTMTYLFTAAAAVQMVALLKLTNVQTRQIALYVVGVLMLTGSAYLVYTGHLGASLVYQQGAGVTKPASDCSDF